MLKSSQRSLAFIRNQVPAVLAVALLSLAPQSRAAVNQAATTHSAVAIQRPEASFPALDNKRLFALGMIETGNNDDMIGRAGEVSRYQLMPVVWKSYSKSYDYVNPQVALQVARAHWDYLANYFMEKTGRVPNDFDMYVLWNTRYGYYAHKGFSKSLLSPVVKDRAERFVNLVYRKD